MTKNATLLLYVGCVLAAAVYINEQQPEGGKLSAASWTTILQKKDKSSVHQAPQQAFTPSQQVTQTDASGDPADDLIQLPEEPQTQGYAPSSIKDFEAADPVTGISMISSPTANSLGNAVLSFNMNIPAGRQGLGPEISIMYNNEGGSSWMGTGWNLSSPAISIDTRWGVPRYDATKESEMYMLNGEQLAPTNNRDTFVARTNDKVFYERVEDDFKKIVRHGTSPSNYWWEVTEKSGLRHFYGGDGTNMVNNAVLKDDDNNIAYWALVETRDLKNNFIRYEYDTVQDPGVAGSTNMGRQIYLARIYYTSNGAAGATPNGPYKVEFIRDRTLQEAKRQDVTVDARLGFKMVSADLLRKVRILYNSDTIRTYDFSYTQGAFYKTVLKSIKELDNTGALFYKQDFEYYDDARTSVTEYKSKATAYNWDIGGDGISGTIYNPIPGYDADATVIGTSTVSSKTGGVVVTLGSLAGDSWTKNLTVGGGPVFGWDKQTEITSLIDINGDGLPDKVFKDEDAGGHLFYRANLGGATRSFGPRRPIIGIGDFGYSETENIGGGVQAIPYDGFFGYNYTKSTTETKIYFADYNGDGLIDVNMEGYVYFNHKGPNGDPVFTMNSKETPCPVFPGILDPEFLKKDTAKQGQQERAYPLQDIIRFWEAPVAGTVNITGTVQLQDVPNTTGSPSTRKDGVRVSIQVGQAAQRWATVIGSADFTPKTPDNVTGIAVNKGTRIYFRMQSVYNGEDDIVNWDPVITYTTPVTPQSDTHHKISTVYKASEDFIVHSKSDVGMGKTGSIAIDGTFRKQQTSDSVFVQVTKDRHGVITTLFQQGFSGNDLFDGSVAAPGQFAVDTSDVLHFRLVSHSYIDRSAMQWYPHFAYMAFAPGDTTPVITRSGSPTLQAYPIPDNSNFNSWFYTAPPVTVTQQDTIFFRPQVTGGNSALWFTLKGPDTVYARRRIFINGGAMNAIDSIPFIRKVGEPLFMEFATDSMEMAVTMPQPTVNVYRDSTYLDTATNTLKDTFVLKSTLPANLYTNPAQEYLGPLFRGWGAFSFKGDKGDGPLDESKINLDEFNAITNTDPNAFTDPANMGNIPDPSKNNFIPVYPDLQKQSWIGYDTAVFITPGTMSSSRLYMHDVYVDSMAAGATAVYKKTTTETNSYSVGLAPGGFGPSLGYSDATTVTNREMMDMNGDRFPDVVDAYVSFAEPFAQVIQYTLPHGGLGTVTKSHDVSLSFAKAYQEGLGLGGEFNKAFTKGQSGSGAVNIAKQGIGIGGSLNFNNDNVVSTWLDVNGDGLPDRVFDNNTVQLNLGYRFLPAETWGIDSVDKATSMSSGGGLGLNLFGGTLEGGVGISKTEGQNTFIMNDINGDGLPDQLMYSPLFGADKVRVKFNTGNGFGPAIPWKGFDDIASLYAVGESYNLAFTIPIPIYIILLKICINPNGNFAQGTTRQEKAFLDIDGDGYADYVQSKNDGQLYSSASAIGRTNMLRSVKSPVGGGSFKMDYERVGNTYDMPQSKWVLKNIMVFDGVPGDGIDTMRSEFSYEGGFQDRYEREFYGFNKVTTRDLNTARNNKVYRSHVQTYYNNSYYNKSLLASEWTEDSAGHKFTQTDYTYDFDSVKENVRFASLREIKKSFYEGASNTNTTTAVQYKYDAVGNITQTVDIGDGNQQDVKTTNISYHNDDTKYLKAIPSSVETTTSEGLKRKRTTSINGAGNVTQIKEYLADGSTANTDIEYDTYGNITKLTRPANYRNQRMSYTFEYDDVVHNYPLKVTDAFGYITTSEYDYKFGVITRSISRNNEETKYVYDNKGRIVKFIGPYELKAGRDHTIAIEYHPEVRVPYAVTYHYDPEDTGDIKVLSYADGLGRNIQLKKQVSLFKGKNLPDDVKMVVSGTSEFDPFGRVTAQYYPVLEDIGNLTDSLNGATGLPQYKDTYDATDRLLKRVLADDATTKVTYTTSNGMISRTVTDALNNKKETLFDVRGRKRFSKEIVTGGTLTTRYDYDALNEIIKVQDNKGNILTATYDNLGRRVGVQHPDAGLTEFVYDLADNLTKKITAQIRKETPNGGAIQYQYDYERLTDIDYPRNYQNKVKYVYGDPGTGVKAGRLILQEDASGGQEFFYSMQGQVVKTIRTVLTSPHFATTFVTETAYDSWNRVKKMVYPDGEEIKYHYNRSGALSSMDGTKRGSDYQFVNQIGYDEFDERVYMRYANGTENFYQFDNKRRQLNNLKATLPTGQAMMNNTYTYDAVSHIMGFINNVQAQANSLGGPASQQYQYDGRYRLDSASGGSNGGTTTSSFGIRYAYDDLNNIVKKTMTGPTSGSGYSNSYTYGGAAPHQATKIGDKTYTYDKNGNQLGYGDIENFYDEENRLMAVVNKGVLSQFTYDAEDNRVVKSSGGMQNIWVNGAPAGAVQHNDNYTIYVNPYVVAKKGEFTKHYYIDGQRVASKLGHGTFTNISFPTSGLTAGGIDYTRRAALIEKARNEYYASLGVSPGPPTDKNFWARPENSGIAAPAFSDTSTGIPPGWPGNIITPPNGPPVFVNAIPSRDSVKAGYGFEEAGHIYEGSIYFYHFDNAGSTTYVTNFEAKVVQHVEYTPSGEAFINEHSGFYETKYLFNGKGYDDETGYYFYGPQYYDPVLNQWLTVPDPSGEGFLGDAMGGYGLASADESDDMISNPSISKIAYSGSSETESSWSEKAVGENDHDNKEKNKRVNNNRARRKVLVNKYANMLLDVRYNRDRNNGKGRFRMDSEEPTAPLVHNVYGLVAEGIDANAWNFDDDENVSFAYGLDGDRVVFDRESITSRSRTLSRRNSSITGQLTPRQSISSNIQRIRVLSGTNLNSPGLMIRANSHDARRAFGRNSLSRFSINSIRRSSAGSVSGTRK